MECSSRYPGRAGRVPGPGNLWWIEGQGWTAVWNPVSLRITYTPGEHGRQLSSGDLAIPLRIREDLGPSADRDQDHVGGNPDIYAMKLIITTRCNLACEYCFIENSLPQVDGPETDMSFDTITQSLEVFADHLARSSAPRGVVNIYGGEPLLRPDSVLFAVRTIREMSERGRFDRDVDTTLETNAMLLTEEMADSLAAAKVTVVVSLDGPREVHDSMRRTHAGDPSWTLARRGFEIASAAGVTTVVSAVLGSHNADKLDAVVRFVGEDLGCRSLGVNLQHPSAEGLLESHIDSDRLADIYVSLLDYGAEYGVYVEQAFRRLRPFVEESFRTRDCPSAGRRIVVRPDGMTGVCEAVCVSDSSSLVSIHSSPDLCREKTFREWYGRTPLTMPTCRGCPAMGLCGGGCVFNAMVFKGNIMDADERFCAISHAVLRWAVTRLADMVITKRRSGSSDWYVPSVDEKRHLYGAAPVCDDATPLWSYSAFVEER